MLTESHKNIINNSYKAVMNGNATKEEELIWLLANQIHCINTRTVIASPEMRKMLNECDFNYNDLM